MKKLLLITAIALLFISCSNDETTTDNQTQFQFYENSRIVIKRIEYPTSYGKDKRQERYSY